MKKILVIATLTYMFLLFVGCSDDTAPEYRPCTDECINKGGSEAHCLEACNGMD